MTSPRIAIACLLGAAVLAWGGVTIDEVMYHPQSESIAEEYIELLNTDASAVDVSGWAFTKGVRFTFPAGTTIPPGGCLVVTASPAAFHAKYPSVSNYVSASGWTGRLSNASDRLVLVDAAGATQDDITYADDGDWGRRGRDDPPDFGHRGWRWTSDADGVGRSLELINPAFDNTTGQNWAASTASEGTPGAANSVQAADIAPVISDVSHFPLVPASSDPVSVTCQVADDHGSIGAVQVSYRNDGAATFTTAAMFDDGAHDDALAGDGVYGAWLPAQADGTIVEFYVGATDGAAHTRTWPAPARDDSGAMVQSQNCLYQVDESAYPGAMPLYRVIVKAADAAELKQINANTPAAPFPFSAGETNDQTYSHATFNATFVSMDGTGAKVRYLAGIRNRGNGARHALPQSFTVSWPDADPWNGATGLNLNAQQTPCQLLGSTIFRKAGLVMAESRAVQVRVNGVNLASSNGSPAYGFYACNEVQDSGFADHHFPLDSAGNLYRGERDFRGTTSGGTAVHGADLGLITPGPSETRSLIDLYKLNYAKHTNESEDDWSDLIELTQALAKGRSGATPGDAITYDPDYETAVRAAADVGQWMRFMAVNTVADNSETNITMGNGDDFYIYFGVADPRSRFVAYDLDGTFGVSGSNSATHGLFRMVTSDESGNPPTPLNAFMKFPAFAPLYYAELVRQIEGPFSSAQFDPVVDSTLEGIAPAGVISKIKSFNASRCAYIASQIPRVLAVTSGPAAVNGYPRTTSAPISLSGVADAVTTRSVKVNGQAATWTAWTASWSASGIALSPGINRILVQAFDGDGRETQRLAYDVHYDDGSVAPVSGTVASNVIWTAGGGPYRVTSNVTVPAGVTLTIEPGTTVYLAPGTSIQASGSGRILANGTETQHITFAREPGVSGNWGSIDFLNTTSESRLSFIDFTGAGGTNIGGHTAQCHVNDAIVFFDHLYFPPSPAVQFISFDAAAFVVQNCYFSTYAGSSGPENLHGVNGIRSGGYGIFRDNYFGHTYGFNDTIDFTGGNRPGPILQFINNVFDGASDDCLDLDSTDAWIEGNVFMHVHRDPSRTDNALDTASAISGGTNTAGQNSDWTILNNIFYDVDHVILNKGISTSSGNGGGRVAFLFNTVAHVAKEISGSTQAEIAAFDWSDDDIALPDASVGSGLYAAFNIISDCAALHLHYDPEHHTVIMDNNILSEPWDGPGSGNQVVNPLLNLDVLAGTPVASVTAEQLREVFQLLPGSPAKGVAPGGRNLGALGAHGIIVSGEPSGTTASTSATITLGPGGTFDWGSIATQRWGWTAYRWKLDDGAWSAEIPVANGSPFASPPVISLAGLDAGPHTLYVSGKSDAGYYQDDEFVYPPDSGTPASVTASKTWTVDPGYVAPAGQAQVLINEVLAKNTDTLSLDGVFPDMLELRNAGAATADLAGWGLTDTPAVPYKYAFPAGTTLAAGACLTVYLSSSATIPQPRTGFALKAGGDSITLTRSVPAGGGVADSVQFGAQLADYSVGRRASDGAWELCRPTFGGANVVAMQGAIAPVKINEWLASAAVTSPDDFIELYNPGPLPVNLGGAFLTDNPADWPLRHAIPPLTFVDAGGYVGFKADGNADSGADHVGFKLSPQQGEIGLFDSALRAVDAIVYGPQSTDVSQGRSPNGSAALAFFTQPTPGGPNPGATGTTVTAIPLIGASQSWKYYAATAAPPNDGSGRAFTESAYDDASWTSGAQLLAIETAGLANTEGFAKTTALPGNGSGRPFQTYYFRTHFTYGGPSGAALQARVMVDDGCVLYLNGQELTAADGSRIGMPLGAVSYSTLANRSVSDATVETFPLPGSALVAGDNVLVAEVHQSSNQSGSSPSSDVVWGLQIDAVTASPAGISPVVLNEVLAINASTPDPDGSVRSWIELFNPGANAVDLADASLSDDPAAPRKFVFPTGASIPAGGYYVIYADGSSPASATNTGFSPPRDGGAILLFEPLSAGGGLRASVGYGRQISDFSIGRVPAGTGAFTLCVPSAGAANAAAGLASATSVKINEWCPHPFSGSDFFELYNTAAQPVALGGTYLTDNLTNRTKHQVPPLSFIGGAGASRWQAWQADGSSIAGHVSFALSDNEALGLYTAGGFALDTRALGTVPDGESRGSVPDGTSAILALIPTPGEANQPLGGDTDSDGMSDAYELANGLDPNDPADAAADADRDGRSNLAELVVGTNPNDPRDFLRASISIDAGGVVTVRLAAVAGKTYTVQYCDDPGSGEWSRLADVPAQGADGLVDVVDAGSAGKTKRFYRVVCPRVP